MRAAIAGLWRNHYFRVVGVASIRIPLSSRLVLRLPTLRHVVLVVESHAVVVIRVTQLGNPRKAWVMPCYTLNHRAQRASSDTKDKRPSILRVQIRIGQDKETLVGLWLESSADDHVEQVTRLDLLPTCVFANTGTHHVRRF